MLDDDGVKNFVWPLYLNLNTYARTYSNKNIDLFVSQYFDLLWQRFLQLEQQVVNLTGDAWARHRQLGDVLGAPVSQQTVADEITR